MNRDGLRLALSIVILVALTAYAFVVRPMEASIAARYGDIDALRAATERDLALARRLPGLMDEQSRLDAQLERQRLRESRAAIVDRFLRATALVSARDGIAVQTIVPGPPVERDTTVTALEEIHLDLTVRGTYGTVLRAMRDLNETDAATQITWPHSALPIDAMPAHRFSTQHFISPSSEKAMRSPLMPHIPSSRSLCAAAALLCFAAAFVLAPTSARSQLAAVPPATSTAQPAIVIPPILAIAPQRDAFAPRARVDDDPATAGPRPNTLPAVPRELAPRTGVAPIDAVRVTAIATGAQSSAIIEGGGTTRVVTVGDSIAHARVTAIETTAVDLDDGKRLLLTSDPAAP